MRKIYIYLLFSIVLFAQVDTNELQWVDAQIEAIKPERRGIEDDVISSLKNPFVSLVVEDKKLTKTKKSFKKKKYIKKIYHKKYIKLPQDAPKFHLSAILNDSVLINDSWYKVGQKIKNYLIKEVKSTQVTLLKGSRVIILSTDTKNNTLKYR